MTQTNIPTVSGNPADDTKALGAGTGAPFTPAGGSAAITSPGGTIAVSGTPSAPQLDVSALVVNTASASSQTAGWTPSLDGSGGYVWGAPSGGAQIAGDLAGTLATPEVATVLNGQVPVSKAAIPFNDRGQIQYSTTYAAWDSVIYGGRRIIFNQAVTTSSGTANSGEPFVSTTKYFKANAAGFFYAADYGVFGDGATDNWATLQTLLILVRSLTTNSNNGFKVILPSGDIIVSKTLIIPTSTMLVGQGLYSTIIKTAPNAACDVIQPEQFNSSAQAATLGTLLSSLGTASTLRNAFRWGLADLTVHGNNTNQPAGDYHHGLNTQTNPLLTTGTGDPDFDPTAIIRNVQFRSCTGDGFFANGRSGMRLVNCGSFFNLGNGFTPSFDTQFDHCLSGFNGITGLYLNHQSNQGAGNKSYNNGDGVTRWASGSNYTAGQRVIDPTNNLLYYALNPLTSDATAPSADPTNWTQITAATSPQAWGYGVYCDTNSAEITLNCDCQQNSAGNFYVKGSQSGAIRLTGVSWQPNFNNVSGAGLNSTNPNNYAAVTLDGCKGVRVDIGSSVVGTSGYHLRLLNGATTSSVEINGDGSGTLLASDSTSPISAGVLARYNGVDQNLGKVVYGNVFGDGSNVAATLDGTATVTWATLSGGNTYTMNRDCFCTNLTINSGITLVVNGYRIFCTGTLNNNNGGTIKGDGTNATSSTAPVNTSGGSFTTYGLGGAGAAGNTGAGAAGTAGGIGSANSGGGGAGASGAGGSFAGNAISTAFGTIRSPYSILAGTFVASSTVTAHKGSPGGGGGGGDGTNKGGAGGAGGNHILIFAQVFINAGTLQSLGGAGFTPTTGNCGGGGGGGGGNAYIYTLSAWTNSGTATFTGGAAGSGIGTGVAGTAGGNGAATNYVLV